LKYIGTETPILTRNNVNLHYKMMQTPYNLIDFIRLSNILKLISSHLYTKFCITMCDSPICLRDTTIKIDF